MTKPKPWTDNITYCQCTKMDDECPNLHEGDILPTRYVLVGGEQWETMEDAIIDMPDFAPFTSEIIKDLAAGAKMKASDFVQRFCQ